MGSGYFGEPNMGNHYHERGGSGGSSSSRKGKKKKKNNNSSSSSEKPKQPQRGLGVAQLEKIRLTGQLAGGCTTTTNNNNKNNYYHHHHPSSFSYGYNQNIMGQMGIGDYERTNDMIRYYGDSSQRPTTVASWNMDSSIYESHHNQQHGGTKQLFNLHEATSRSKKHRSDYSNGSSSQNSESSDGQELDLELRLSL
ncbi:unnamed protein product [Linum trigynum]|uniref:Protein SPEAR3-like n=1 Tax=Linum trigynum TaxID=586398 RepID=A0AAV2GXN4_9ROSI